MDLGISGGCSFYKMLCHHIHRFVVGWLHQKGLDKEFYRHQGAVARSCYLLVFLLPSGGISFYITLCFQLTLLGIITVTDASFCNEQGLALRQGRAHLLANVEQMKDESVYIYHVLPLGFSSTIKRACRSTLQDETYSLQSGIESGDKIRALIAETTGQLHSRRDWESIMRSCVRRLQFSDCH